MAVKGNKIILEKGVYRLTFKLAKKILNRDKLKSIMFLFSEPNTGETIQRTIVFNNEAQSNLNEFVRKLSNNEDTIWKNDILTALEKINKHKDKEFLAFIEPNKTNTYNNITSIMSEAKQR
jgi:hypothetical protein